MSAFDETACLSHDPFAGDYDGDGQSDRVLEDRIVTCRKVRECHLCAQPTTPGSRIRSRAEVYDGELMRFAWCEPCCIAMAEQDDAALDLRAQLREEPRP